MIKLTRERLSKCDIRSSDRPGWNFCRGRGRDKISVAVAGIKVLPGLGPGLMLFAGPRIFTINIWLPGFCRDYDVSRFARVLLKRTLLNRTRLQRILLR